MIGIGVLLLIVIYIAAYIAWCKFRDWRRRTDGLDHDDEVMFKPPPVGWRPKK